MGCCKLFKSVIVFADVEEVYLLMTYFLTHTPNHMLNTEETRARVTSPLIDIFLFFTLTTNKLPFKDIL